jgi:hypothetical protein
VSQLLEVAHRQHLECVGLTQASRLIHEALDGLTLEVAAVDEALRLEESIAFLQSSRCLVLYPLSVLLLVRQISKPLLPRIFSPILLTIVQRVLIIQISLTRP